jgi:tripartite-type tricarboxylate transporter receptor subunit TctC
MPIKDGKLKLLGIVSDRRLPQFPDAPAVTGVLTGLQADAWTGIAAPPRTPRPITEKLSQAIAEVLQMPDVRERILALQSEPVGNTPESMRAMIRNDTDRWAPVIRAASISLD